MNVELILPVLLQTLAGIVSTLTYSVLMRVKLRHFPAIAVGAAITYLVYWFFDFMDCDVFVSNMMGAMVAAIYSEIMARLLKAPVAIYSIPSIILLVPGGSLYYTMIALMQGNRAEVLLRGSMTVRIALGIAVGILAVSVVGVFLPRPGYKQRPFRLRIKK